MVSSFGEVSLLQYIDSNVLYDTQPLRGNRTGNTECITLNLFSSCSIPVPLLYPFLIWSLYSLFQSIRIPHGTHSQYCVPGSKKYILVKSI